MKTLINIPVPLGREYQQEVTKNIYWIDSRIEHVDYQIDRDDVLEVEYNGSHLPEAVCNQIKDTAERIIMSINRVQISIVFDYTNLPLAYNSDPHPELISKGWIKQMFNGGYMYSGLFLKLFNALDKKFREYSLSIINCEYNFPSLLNYDAGRQSGYFENYPHNANFVCHVHEDVETISSLRETLNNGSERPDSDNFYKSMKVPDVILSPNICYHYWSSLTDSSIDCKTINGGTASGSCYRHEGKATTAIQRLREFCMREAFAIGTPEEIVKVKDEFLQSQIAFLELYKIAGTVETAADPFFVDNYSEKRMFQVSMDLKYEVRALLPYKDSSLAISSVNYHQDYFSNAFNISSSDGRELHSCCLAFGVDRWCLAVFAQYGTDINKWPDTLKHLVQGGE